MDLTKISKYISLILRHKPQTIGITLSEQGWADVDALIDGVSRSYSGFDRALLDEIVATDNKQRYSYSEDGTKIRANQGHSVKVDVELKEAVPPDILWHGTAVRFVESINAKGLIPMGRLYVHLSMEVATARNVGSHHGKPAIYKVNCAKMVQDGYKFYLSENKVWLTKAVPVEYLELTDL